MNNKKESETVMWLQCRDQFSQRHFADEELAARVHIVSSEQHWENVNFIIIEAEAVTAV